MQEFTPETLKNFISQHKEHRDPDLILKNIESKKEQKSNKNNSPLVHPHIAEMDKQIRDNLVSIIRYMLKSNKKEDLKKILEEHKNFIDNILNELIKK